MIRARLQKVGLWWLGWKGRAPERRHCHEPRVT